jgi:hypothetical protein
MSSVCPFFAASLSWPLSSFARAEQGGAGHYAPGSFASFIDVLQGNPNLGALNYFTYYNGSAGASRKFETTERIAANVQSKADYLLPKGTRNRG